MRRYLVLPLALLPLACEQKAPEPTPEERPAIEQPAETAAPVVPASRRRAKGNKIRCADRPAKQKRPPGSRKTGRDSARTELP